MQHLLSFNHAGRAFSVEHLETQGRVQLWYQWEDGQPWEIGHGKDVPSGMTPREVAETMRRFIRNEFDLDYYNELLPA